MEFKKIPTGMLDYDSYFADVPAIKLVAHFVNILSYDKVVFEGKIEIGKESFNIKVNYKTDEIYVNGELHSPIYFVCLMNGDDCDFFSIIKDITGVDHTDYYYEINIIDMSEKNPTD